MKRAVVSLLVILVVLSACVPMTIEFRPQSPVYWRWTVTW